MKGGRIRNLISIAVILISISPLWRVGDALGALSITVLYDNAPFQEDLQPDWGFSCLIKIGKKDILFDTGKDGRILFSNIGRLGIDLKAIDQIVISHLHLDHIGGLMPVLEMQPKAVVLMPESTPGLNQQLRERRISHITVDRPLQIGKELFLTGAMGEGIKEQALIINTPLGLIVVGGCSHPGIVNIIKRSKTLWDKPVYLVIGGFHSMPGTMEGMSAVVSQFRQLGVRKVAPAHCTSEPAKAFFKAAYGKDYIAVGAGKVLTFSTDKNAKKKK
jgi:7,8-dihydropterin-6-yl-methyl-4-(beta-D-ribofuranosyl)aminobenzene 5'-phosphate synthase